MSDEQQYCDEKHERLCRHMDKKTELRFDIVEARLHTNMGTAHIYVQCFNM